MKIAVLGASGNFGVRVSGKLEGEGHEVVRISRSLGVDVLSGDGLREAFEGVDVALDCLNVEALSGRKALEFFAGAAANTVAAAQEQGVGRIVCLGIAGAINPLVNQRFGYYKGKAAQENIYQAADLPSTTVRSTQWCEFVPDFAGRFAKGPVALLPTMMMAPAAADSVAAFVADVVSAPHRARNDIVAIRGPEANTAAHFARRFLEARGDLDGQEPKVLKEAPFLGHAIASGGLVPQDAHVDPVTFDEWLRRG